MATVTLDQVKMTFGKTPVLQGIDLGVADGEFVVLLGPSGCGKSTALRIIAGLEDQTGGSVLIDGRAVDHLPPAKRGVAMVFQSYALYPHLSVAGNWALGLKQAGEQREVIDRRVAEAARILELEELLARKPAELSGGQRQRVAIGRAIVRHPEVFLFDEPLSNLDATLRSQVRYELARLHKQLAATMLYVTHDQIEAMTLADRIVVMHQGVIQQVGTPAQLYRTPVNLFVAGFIGSPAMNFLPAGVDADGRLALDYSSARLDAPLLPSPGSRLTVGVRPDGLTLQDPNGALLSGRVLLNEYLGRESYLHVELTDADAAVVVVEVAPDNAYRPGDHVGLGVSDGEPNLHLHFFDAKTGRRYE